MINIHKDYALVVDDEQNNRSFATKLLENAGLKVCSASTGAQGIAMAKEYATLTLAIIDQELPDMTGIGLIRALRNVAPQLTLVMATVHDDKALIDKAFSAGATCFLVKPHGFIELYRAILHGSSDILSDQKRYVIDHYGPHAYREPITVTLS